MKTEFKIPLHRQAEAEAAIAKLQKKGAKFGVSPLTFSWGEPFAEMVNYGTQEQPEWRKRVYVKLEVEGQPPRVAGFTFIARIEFAEAGVLVQTVPGNMVPEKFWNTTAYCEHCKTKRYRKDVFVVRNEAGEHMQVGRQCLQDFLGNDPAVVLRSFQWLRSVGEELNEERWGFGSGSFPIYEPLELLTKASAVIKRYGWLSKSAAREHEIPTASIVGWEDGTLEQKKEWKREIVPIMNEADEKLAAEVLAWVRGLEPNNEYLHNLKIVLGAKFIYQWRHVGLAVSAIAAYLKAQAREAELNEKWKLNKKSEWQGEVGKRLRNIKIKLEAAITLPETQWGQSILFKFRDENGNLYTTMTQAELGLSINEEAMLTGTVKDHREYKGTKETLLSRVAVTEVPKVQQPSML